MRCLEKILDAYDPGFLRLLVPDFKTDDCVHNRFSHSSFYLIYGFLYYVSLYWGGLGVSFFGFVYFLKYFFGFCAKEMSVLVFIGGLRIFCFLTFGFRLY